MIDEITQTAGSLWLFNDWRRAMAEISMGTLPYGVFLVFVISYRRDLAGFGGWYRDHTLYDNDNRKVQSR